MRKSIVMILLSIFMVIGPFLGSTPAFAKSASISPTCTRDPYAPGCAQQAANVQAQSSTSSTSATQIITGNNLFHPPGTPVIGNYVFDSDGFTGNFDPLYWMANLLFSLTVAQLYTAIEFFSLGSSTNGINGVIAIALKILHASFAPMVGTIFPLAVLFFIGVFIWFGVIKKNIHAVSGRGIKSLAVLLLFMFLASPAITDSHLLQNISKFPVSVGNAIGSTIDGVITVATKTNTTGTGVCTTSNSYSNAWDSIVLPEWIAGEEGQNYNMQGTKVVSLCNGNAAWRYILGYPLQNGQRNGVVGTLQSMPDGPIAFSSPNRLDVSVMALIGNLGPTLYFLVMGAIMLFARLMFVVLVAAGAVILPLELFPVTRSVTLTLKWMQYLIMSLFVLFFVSVYSAVLFGLTQLTEMALQGTAFSNPSHAVATGRMDFISNFSFIGNGLAYLIAIYVAWRLYKKMKPMQRIEELTKNAAKRGVSLGGGQRLTAEEKRKNRSPLLRGRNNMKRRTMADRIQDAAGFVKEASIIGASQAAMRHRKDPVDVSREEETVTNEFDDNVGSKYDDHNEFSQNETMDANKNRSFSEWTFEPENGEHRIDGEAFRQLEQGGHHVPSPPHSHLPLNDGVAVVDEPIPTNQDALTDEWGFEGNVESPEHLIERVAQDSTSEPKEPFTSTLEEQQWQIIAKEKRDETDYDAPTHRFASTERSQRSESEGVKSNKPPIRKTEQKASEVIHQKLKKEPSNKPSDDVIAKWESRLSKVTKMVAATKVLSSPDQAMDTFMGVTLGFAAEKVVSAGKGAAFHLIRHIASQRAEAENQQKMPKQVKRQTNPVTVKARKEAEMSETHDMKKMNDAYQDALRQSTPRRSPIENNDQDTDVPKTSLINNGSDHGNPLTPSVSPMPPILTEAPVIPVPPIHTNRQGDNGQQPTSNNHPKPSNDSPNNGKVSASQPIRPLLRRKSPRTADTMGTLRVKNAAISQIRSVQRRSSRQDRVKRIARYTQATLPTNKSKKTSSLANAIFGNRNRRDD